jgi:flap endonuclease-1
MGIRGLTGWIKWAAPNTISAPNWSDYADKTIGVDILGALYKIKAQRACPIKYMAQFIAACKLHEINPIFVFDGKPPDAKRAALKQRSDLRTESLATLKVLETEVAPLITTDDEKTVFDEKVRTLYQNTCYFTSEERDQCKQLCYACGVISLNATGEADDVLAYLYHKGVFAAVISNDLDLLARGVQDLFVPQLYAVPGDDEGWIAYNLDKILATTNFTMEQFVQMCILMGCDYNVGQKTLPFRSAYFAIKYRGEMLKTLEVLGVSDETPYYEAQKRLNGLCETKESLMGEKQWTKLSGPAPPVEHESLEIFRNGPLKMLSNYCYTLLYGRTYNDTINSS